MDLTIDTVFVILLVVLVFLITGVIVYKFPGIQDWILHNIVVWAGGQLQDMGLLLRLDDIPGYGPGTTIEDSSGWGNNGIFGDPAPSWHMENHTAHPNSILFDQNGEYIKIENTTNLGRLNPNSITIEFWVKIVNDSACGTILKKDQSYQVNLLDSWEIQTTFNIVGKGQVTKQSDNVLNKYWTYVAITYNNQTGKESIFINNQIEDFQNVGPGNFDSSNSPLYIGGSSSCGPLNLVIDDIAIYNRVLSSEEIMTHYQGIY